MLFVDKYRPKSLDDLHYHEDLSDRLRSLSAHEDFPHLLFYGPAGAGKKTRVMALMKELYGPGALKLKIEQRTFLTPSRRKVEVNIVSSSYHIELTPSDAGNYDRLVVQDILKEIAQTQQVDVNAKHRFKVVIINEADSLSRDAQSALRRTMEKYMGNLRLILCATSTSKIIAPIRSRCLLMRVGSPNAGEMLKCLKHVSKKENFFLPDEVANAIYEDSNGNLRKAILVLETLKSQNKDLMKLQNKPDIGIAKPDWEIYSNETAEMIIKVQSPEQLLLVRARMYELLVHAIPPRLILKTLADYLVTKVDESIKEKVIEKAAMFELRCRTGSKAIFHLEGFVAQVMTIQKAVYMGLDEIDWE